MRAQCSPRHACPLNGALLMQLHQWAQAAAGLAQERDLRVINACKTMHLMRAWLFLEKWRDFWFFFVYYRTASSARLFT